MLSTWKRATGMAYTPPNAYRDAVRSSHEKKEEVAVVPEKTVTSAFGSRAVPSLCERLVSEDVGVLRRALRFLNENTLKKQKNVIEAVRTVVTYTRGIEEKRTLKRTTLELLLELTEHDEVDVRISALECTKKMCACREGRQALLDKGLLTSLFGVIKARRHHYTVKRQAYNVVRLLALSRQTVRPVLNVNGLLTFLMKEVHRKVDKQSARGNVAKVGALSVLTACLRCRDGVDRILSADAPSLVTSCGDIIASATAAHASLDSKSDAEDDDDDDLLSERFDKKSDETDEDAGEEDAEAKADALALRVAKRSSFSLAVEAMQSMCMTERGRVLAVKGGRVVPALLIYATRKRSADDDVRVRRNALATLASLTLGRSGKRQVFDVDGVDRLVSAIKAETDLWCQQNLVKIIGTMACMPSARALFREQLVVASIDAIANASKTNCDDDTDETTAMTRDIARRTIEAILWDP